MDTRDTIQIGRVMRLGQGWVDLLTDQGMCRVCINPGFLFRVGSHVKVVNKQAVTALPAASRHSTLQWN